MATKAKKSAKSSKKSAAKKSSARRVIKSSWSKVRHGALDGSMKIVLKTDNPYREGSTRWHAFEALKKGKTVEKALGDTFEKGKTGTTHGMRRYVLRNLVHQDLAKVG
jgi:hypothetical protein